jgi:integrase
MSGVPNTLRRAGVYYFRRAIPIDVQRRLRRAELCCSLRTNRPGIAHSSARHLYLRSEELFDFIRLSPMLSENQLARLVQEFYATVLDRENQLRLLGRLSTDEAGRTEKIAYWADVAERTRQDLATNNFASADATAARAIHQLGLTGQLATHEVRQIQQALLRGGADLAEALKARYEGNFAYEPKDPLLRMELERAEAEPATKVVPAEPRAPTSAPASSKGSTGLPFVERAEQFRQSQVRRNIWEQQSALQARKTYELFAEVAGNRPLDGYLKEDAVRFKNALQDLPANYGKSVRFRGMGIAAIAEATANESCARLSSRTIQRHISALSSLWEAAIEGGEASINIFSGFKFANAKKASEQRAMWSEDKLTKLFASPIWTGCHSIARRSKPGSLVIRDERFWLPLIAVYSGMRQEEICQLHTTDIRLEGDIWVFDVNDQPPKQLKNSNAVRLVPIHSKLIEFGFLKYVEQQRRAGRDLVFHQLTRGGADHRLGHNFSKWFTRYRTDIGLYEPLLDFHSFRHSATTFMQWSNVPEPIIDKLTGHATAGETARYTKEFQITQLQDGIEGIRPNITLSHLARNGSIEALTG